jgi:hypothetical protein
MRIRSRVSYNVLMGLSSKIQTHPQWPNMPLLLISRGTPKTCQSYCSSASIRPIPDALGACLAENGMVGHFGARPGLYWQNTLVRGCVY